jgi:hypothetical protein
MKIHCKPQRTRNKHYHVPTIFAVPSRGHNVTLKTLIPCKIPNMYDKNNKKPWKMR